MLAIGHCWWNHRKSWVGDQSNEGSSTGKRERKGCKRQSCPRVSIHPAEVLLRYSTLCCCIGQRQYCICCWDGHALVWRDFIRIVGARGHLVVSRTHFAYEASKVGYFDHDEGKVLYDPCRATTCPSFKLVKGNKKDKGSYNRHIRVQSFFLAHDLPNPLSTKFFIDLYVPYKSLCQTLLLNCVMHPSCHKSWRHVTSFRRYAPPLGMWCLVLLLLLWWAMPLMLFSSGSRSKNSLEPDDSLVLVFARHSCSYSPQRHMMLHWPHTRYCKYRPVAARPFVVGGRWRQHLEWDQVYIRSCWRPRCTQWKVRCCSPFWGA